MYFWFEFQENLRFVTEGGVLLNRGVLWPAVGGVETEGKAA